MGISVSRSFGLFLTAMTIFCPALGWGQSSDPSETPTLEQGQQLEEKVQHLDKHLIHRPETRGTSRILDGIEIEFGVTGIVQGSSNTTDPSGEDHTDASGSLDLEVQSRIGDRGTAFLLVESGQGEGLTDEIETLHGINADAVEDHGDFKLTEAWYEHRFLDDRLLFTLGKVDLTNYFDTNAVANDETLQFLADGFVNNIAVEFPEENGPGLRLAYHLKNRFEIGLGLGELDADFEDVGKGTFEILEFVYKSNSNGLEGNYRVYAWTHRSDHAEWNTPWKDNEKNWGLGISLDQRFHQRFTGFLRAGIQDKSVSRVDLAVSFGGEFRGLFPQRGPDVLAFALGFAHLSKDYEDSLALLDLDHEQMLEVYYSFHMNDHLIISPDIQMIRNPVGQAVSNTVTILGVRAQVLF